MILLVYENAFFVGLPIKMKGNLRNNDGIFVEFNEMRLGLSLIVEHRNTSGHVKVPVKPGMEDRRAVSFGEKLSDRTVGLLRVRFNLEAGAVNVACEDYCRSRSPFRHAECDD